jgi:hypothetical protein
MFRNQSRFFLILPILLLMASCHSSNKSRTVASVISFASVEKGQQALIQEDDVTKSWSQFDLDSRVQKKDATKAELFSLIQSSVLAFTKEEEALVKGVVEEVDAIIAQEKYYLPLPEEILIVKTNMKEEGGAMGYTRANNIILSEEAFKGDTAMLKYLIIHELFHVLSRNDADFKKAMYAIIGFTTTSEIAFPASWAALRITNPDAPLVDAYIQLNTPDSLQDCAMILYSDRPYEGGSFFDYLNFVFVKLNGKEKKSIALVDGQPVIYTFDQVSNFIEQVGANTQYIIHPEEILADNFTELLIGGHELPDPWLVEEMKAYLVEE